MAPPRTLVSWIDASMSNAMLVVVDLRRARECMDDGANAEAPVARARRKRATFIVSKASGVQVVGGGWVGLLNTDVTRRPQYNCEGDT